MIIYTDPVTGNVCSCSKSTSVPNGVTWYEVDAPADRGFRDAWKISNGQLDYDLPKAKAIVVKKAAQKCDEDLKVITNEYPESEMKTWDIQEAEARSAGETPFLNALAASSGKSVTELKAKIIANADAYKSISASEIGKRQAVEKAVALATTIEELKAIAL